MITSLYAGSFDAQMKLMRVYSARLSPCTFFLESQFPTLCLNSTNSFLFLSTNNLSHSLSQSLLSCQSLRFSLSLISLSFYFSTVTKLGTMSTPSPRQPSSSFRHHHHQCLAFGGKFPSDWNYKDDLFPAWV